MATYVVVGLGRLPGLRLDRTGAAVVGAAFMVAFQVVTPEQAYRLVDMGTLVLLFGMMVLVGHLRLAGFFRWAGVTVARRARTPHQLLAGLVFLSGVLSALREVRSPAALAAAATVLSNLVSNVPAMMLFTPLVPHLPDPRQTWLVLAMASTLAGNLTLVGSIANLIVAEGARKTSPLTFAEYLKAGVPVTLLTLGIGIWWLS